MCKKEREKEIKKMRQKTEEKKLVVKKKRTLKMNLTLFSSFRLESDN